MKKVFYFSLMVMAMFMMAACSSSSSPGDAMKKYSNYLIKGDYEKFVDGIALDDSETADKLKEQKAGFVALLRDKVGKEYEKMGGLKSIEILSEEISEDGKKLRTKIADLILNIVGKIKTAVGKLFRIVQNFLGMPKRILKKMQSLALTIRNFCDKINWWKEFLDHPRTREALSFLWKNAKKLIYHVLPTRITGKITFGNEDPAVTGMVLAVLGMTIPFHKNKIEAAPLFDDENVLEGEILLKGRIYGIVVLKTATELYFNKNIKYVIHRWRHKEVNHGERE